jgi:hypothetical protein
MAGGGAAVGVGDGRCRSRFSLAGALGEDELKWRLRSHSVPYEPLRANDHDALRLARAESLAKAIGQLAEGSGWKPEGA